MRKYAALFLAIGAFRVMAQETPQPAAQGVPQGTSDNTLTSLAGEFFNGDFVNYYGFASGVFDTTQATLNSARNNSEGITVGGGVTASKRLSNGIFSLSYRGDYRNYTGGGSDSSGTDQNLSLIYSRRLGHRWTLSLQETAGILFYNQGFYTSLSPTGGTQTNPFSPSTSFLSSSAYLSYRQTARLTYTFGGSLFLNRYSYPGAIGSTGGIVTASASYAVTARTNVGGTYTHDNFVFQRNAGNSNIDGVYGNLSHTFGHGWLVNLSAGVTRAHSSGFIDQPVKLIVGGQTVVGYLVGPYNDVSEVPTVQGSVNHHFLGFNLSASAGRGVNPGNGTYLTSDNTYFGGYVSRGFRKSVVTANASYSRVTSIANAISQAYSSNSITASYSRILLPHLSVYGTYQYLRYGALLNYSSTADNRFVFGVALSSKSIPLTIF